MKVRRLFLFSIIVCSVMSGLALLLNIALKTPGPELLEPEWGGGDALNYMVGIVGAASTFFLGLIAYRQNEKLHGMEKNNYIANHGSLLIINRVSASSELTIPTSWDMHQEQVVLDSGTRKLNSVKDALSFMFCFEATWIGRAVPVAIHIRKCKFFSGQNDIDNQIFDGETYRKDCYSKIAILSKDKVKFNMSYVFNKSDRQKVIDASKDLMVAIEMDVITDKKVGTSCSCNITCHGTSNAGGIEWKSYNPQIFYNNSYIVDKWTWMAEEIEVFDKNATFTETMRESKDVESVDKLSEQTNQLLRAADNLPKLKDNIPKSAGNTSEYANNSMKAESGDNKDQVTQDEQYRQVIEWMQSEKEYTTREVADYLGLKEPQTRQILNGMVKNGKLQRLDGTKGRRYKKV